MIRQPIANELDANRGIAARQFLSSIVNFAAGTVTRFAAAVHGHNGHYSIAKERAGAAAHCAHLSLPPSQGKTFAPL